MNGHPIGCKCVITWSQSSARIGEIVTVTSPAEGAIDCGDYYMPGNAFLIQRMDIESTVRPGVLAWHRCDWMRPLNDGITEDDRDVVRQLTQPRRGLVFDHVTKELEVRLPLPAGYRNGSR